MSLYNQILWGEGVAFADGVELFEIQNLIVNFGVDVIEGVKGDGGGNIIVPVSQPISGRAEFLGMNPDNFAILTGASNATGRYVRVRQEAQTKSTNTITLSNTPLSNSERVIASGANKIPLKRVAATPAVGEYTISGDTITLNASQSESDFLIDYIYSDGSNGITSTFGPSTLPSSFEMIGTLRTKELFGDTTNDLVFKATKCERTSEFGLGAANRAFANPGFDFNIRVDSSGDLIVSWPN